MAGIFLASSMGKSLRSIVNRSTRSTAVRARIVRFWSALVVGLLLPLSPAIADAELEFGLAEVPVAPTGYGNFNSAFGDHMIMHDQRLLMAGKDGRVLVFEPSGDDWLFVQALDLIDREFNNQAMTTRMAVSGEYFLASVVDFDSSQVVAYRWDGGSYVVHQVLAAPLSGTSGGFGSALAATDHYVMVGEPYADNGKVWLYSPPPALDPLGSIAADESLAELWFGAELTATNELLAVAAPGDWFGGPGVVRVFDLNGTGTGDDFNDYFEIQSSWFGFGRRLALQDDQLFVSGFLYGDSAQEIGRIGLFEPVGGQWVLERTFEAGQGQLYEASLHGEFAVDESGIYSLRIEASAFGEIEALQWIVWPIVSGVISDEPIVLADRESLGLLEWSDQARLGGLLIHDSTILVGDTQLGFRSSGGAVRAVIVDQQLERRPDITPPRTAFSRQLGAGLVAGSDFVAVGAPGWCEVYLLGDEGTPITTISSTNADEACGGFGAQVAVHGDQLVVSAPFESQGATESGSVYVLDSDNGAVVQTLTPQEPVWRGRFGQLLATHEDRLLILDASDVAVYQWTGSSYQLIQRYPYFVPAGTGQGFSFDILGDLFVLAAYTNSLSRVEVMAWDGSSYVRRGAAIEETAVRLGSGLLLASGNRLLIAEPPGQRLRDYRLIGEEWIEAESIWGQYSGFGTTIARTPCGFVVADFEGLTRFNQIAHIPDNGLRLSYDEFTWLPADFGSVNLVNFAGNDYMAAYELGEAERYEGRLFKVSARQGLFRSRFESQLCSF